MPTICPAPHLARLRPPAIGFGRRRRSWVSGDAHKPLNVQEDTRNSKPKTPRRSSDRYCQGSDLAERSCRKDAPQYHLLPDLPRCGRAVEDDAEFWPQRPVGSRQGRRSGALAHLRAAAGRGRVRTGRVKPRPWRGGQPAAGAPPLFLHQHPPPTRETPPGALIRESPS